MLLAACGKDDKKAAPPSSSSPAASSAAATTTTGPPPVYPLTGLPVDDRAKAARPALVVKMDNADGGGCSNSARPQTGLNQADVIYEELVEGGVERLAAIFHQGDSDPVGPVRSARLTDIDVFSPLHHPLYAYSGGNGGVLAAIADAPQTDVGYGSHSDAYFRTRNFCAPHNQFSSTPELFSFAPDGAQPPPPLFPFRAANEPLSASARPVASINVNFGGLVSPPIDWVWDAASGTFLRSQKGTPHVDSNGVQDAQQNVIVQFTSYFFNGDTDVIGTPVPQADLIGGGDCWVLTAGTVTDCHWAKANPAAVIQYTDAAGAPVKLTPGRTWVELVPPGGATVTG